MGQIKHRNSWGRNETIDSSLLPIPGCDCTKCGRARGRQNAQVQEAGTGFIGGTPMYYDTNPDGSTNIFPGGVPRGRNEDFPHDKTVINQDGGVEFMREDGEVINNYRDYHGS